MESENPTPEDQEQTEVKHIEVSPQLYQMSQITAMIWLDLAQQEEQAYRELAAPEIKALFSRARLMTDPTKQQECMRRIEEIGSYGRFVAHTINLLKLFSGTREEIQEEQPEEAEPASVSSLLA